MKVKDLITKVNKIKQFEETVYIGEIAEHFDLVIYNWDEQTRLISYYFGNWYCTDSTVGYKVYFFDDKPVAVSSQLGRKSDEEIEWISKECYQLVKEYILSFYLKEDIIQIVDLEQEFDSMLSIDYYCQMFEHHRKNAIYNGESVKIINHKDSFNDSNLKFNPETVKIQYSNNKTEWVETTELRFPFNLTV